MTEVPGTGIPAIRRVVIGTAAVASVVTAAVALIPELRFAYRDPALHVALETSASLVALLAGFLVAGRLWRLTRLNELVLACALAVLALSSLLFGTVPALLGPIQPDLTAWAALAGRSAGALLFALAAFVPGRRLGRPGPVLAAGAAGVAAVLLLIAVSGGVLARWLSKPVSATLPTAARPDLHAHPALLAMQLVMAVLYGLAAAGFLRRSGRYGDEFLGWLAVAAVLAAASHANYFLYPSQYSQWVYTGDAFRLACYAVLLAGSMREISSYWRGLSEAAVLAERHRIACDLHDGLAQELAYLGRNLSGLDGQADGGVLGRLQRAVERAQSESQRAIRTLAAPGGQSADIMLSEAAGEVAERFRIQLELDLAPGIRLPATRAEALVRIGCEAVTNAGRHSGANRVRVSLERAGSRVRLRVSDAGRGFDTAAPGCGFGIISMRERASSAGGGLSISSLPGRGTEVEAVL